MGFRLEYEMTSQNRTGDRRPHLLRIRDRSAADISHNASYGMETEGRRAPRGNAAFGDFMSDISDFDSKLDIYA